MKVAPGNNVSSHTGAGYVEVLRDRYYDALGKAGSVIVTDGDTPVIVGK